MADQEKAFDPSRHLIDIQGKQYLPVNWRLFWLRDSHPDADIETELVHESAEAALFKAKVVIPGRGSATGYGSETADDFGDFIEKAETKALGRALAALGFGTQFCDDFDEGGTVTDSPVQRRTQLRKAQPAPAPLRPSTPQGPSRDGLITEAQAGAIHTMLPKAFPDERDQFEWVERMQPAGVSGTKVTVNGLTKQQASAIITELNELVN